MNQGTVRRLQARVGITFLLPASPSIEIEFVVDTGFEGALTLPPEAVAALGLPFFQEIDANLADDNVVKADIHSAMIQWHGRELPVAVLALGRRPLLGTALLEGFHLGVDFLEDGVVTLSQLA